MCVFLTALFILHPFSVMSRGGVVTLSSSQACVDDKICPALCGFNPLYLLVMPLMSTPPSLLDCQVWLLCCQVWIRLRAICLTHQAPSPSPPTLRVNQCVLLHWGWWINKIVRVAELGARSKSVWHLCWLVYLFNCLLFTFQKILKWGRNWGAVG